MLSWADSGCIFPGPFCDNCSRSSQPLAVVTRFPSASTTSIVTSAGTPAVRTGPRSEIRNVEATPIASPTRITDEVAVKCSRSVRSLAVIVKAPGEWKVTSSQASPLIRGAAAGNSAVSSVLLSRTMWLMPVYVSQLSTVARTSTCSGTPTVCGSASPVKPDSVPGAGSSPGTRICSFWYGHFSGAAAAGATASDVIAIAPSKIKFKWDNHLLENTATTFS